MMEIITDPERIAQVWELERAKHDLQLALKRIRYAATQGDYGAEIKLGVLSKGPGEGVVRVIASWDYAAFARDLELVLGAGPQILEVDPYHFFGVRENET
jgi:predicted secreted Zn-dependent protease